MQVPQVARARKQARARALVPSDHVTVFLRTKALKWMNGAKLIAPLDSVLQPTAIVTEHALYQK